jgi:RimJ/RimL family protein N-acetyltransferase
MKLVPDSFNVPEKLETPKFIIRKLTFRDTDLDYKAVMSSIDIIRKTRGGSWPSPDLTYEDDQIDLGWHQREFENRTSFAYTVMSPDEKECLGCLYLYPPGHRNESSKNADVDVSFWVTQKAYEEGLYKELFQALDSWLKSTWPFKNVIYTNVEIPTN